MAHLLVTYIVSHILDYVGVLFVNMLGGMAAMIEGMEDSGKIFAFSLVSILIFSPLSFICWFRPLYKAFRFSIKLIQLFPKIEIFCLFSQKRQFIQFYGFLLRILLSIGLRHSLFNWILRNGFDV